MITLSNSLPSSSATNLAGGAAGVVAFQTGSGATSFTAAGTSGQLLQSAGTGTPTWVTANTLAVAGAAPATATSTGTTGQVAFDATHIYVCVNTNVWVRATLATF